MTELEQLRTRLESTEAELRALRNGASTKDDKSAQIWDYYESVLSAIVNAVPHPIFWKDNNGVYRGCNEAFAKEVGCSLMDIIGSTDSELTRGLMENTSADDNSREFQLGLPIPSSGGDSIIAEEPLDPRPVSKEKLRDRTGKVIGVLGTFGDPSAQMIAERKLEKMHGRLLEYSRQSGMADVATTVLHNVGNVLNSINVSSSLAIEKIRGSQVTELERVVTLLDEHNDDLADFVSKDGKGQQLAGYLGRLSSHLIEERQEVIDELEFLDFNIEHVKEIISMQQSYAFVSNAAELTDCGELGEDSLRMNMRSLERHGIDVHRDFRWTPMIEIEKYKVMQVLVNLIQNAKTALIESEQQEKVMTLRVFSEAEYVKIQVVDNGIGIEEGIQPQLFDSGFTTKSGGLGLGLHSGALAAKEMGGRLTVHSDGPGQGATFTLELPRAPKK